jgi:cell division protein FtsW
MIFFAGISVRFFTVLGAFSVAMAIVLIRFSENKLARFKLWWSHVQDFVLRLLPDNIADFLRAEKMPEQYQLSHSLNAINHGGLFGNGIGNGLEKLGPLSEIHTDFVLAGISEEIGAIAVIIIALIFFVIIHTIFKIANRCENKTHTLFALGVGFLMIFAPFMINAFGIMGITPIKGIAVPFISYGGSSLLATSIGIGMVLMISKKAKP